MSTFFIVILFLLSVTGFSKNLNIGRHIEWKGKKEQDMSRDEKLERKEFISQALASQEPTCFNATLLYGLKQQNGLLEKPVPGVAVVCPDVAFVHLCQKVARAVWEQMQVDLAQGISLRDMVVVTPMRGGMPLMIAIASLLQKEAPKLGLSGMPIFIPTLQERRKTYAVNEGQFKVPLHQSLQGRNHVAAAYIVDDIVKSGGTIADDMLNVIAQMQGIRCVRAFTMFAAEGKGATYKYSRILPGCEKVAQLAGAADPAVKLHGLFESLKEFFAEGQRKIDLMAWSAVHISGGKKFWLVSPFEAGMPGLSLEDTKDHLGEVLQTVKSFANFGPHISYDKMVCVMIPALGVFNHDSQKVYGIYRKSFFISNAAGDVMRYASQDTRLAKVQAHFPKKLAEAPGTICSPFIRVDYQNGECFLPEGDLLSGERAAIRTNLALDVEVTPSNTLVILANTLEGEGVPEREKTHIYNTLAQNLRGYGYSVFSMQNEPNFYARKTLTKMQSFPIFHEPVDSDEYLTYVDFSPREFHDISSGCVSK